MNEPPKSPVLFRSPAPIGGTARLRFVESVVPSAKRERERFWCEQLVSRLRVFENHRVTVSVNPDDAHGRPDIIVQCEGWEPFGVQVTELTFWVNRTRERQRHGYVRKLVELVRSNGLSSANKVAAVIHFDAYDKKVTAHAPEKVFKELCAALAARKRVRKTSFGWITISRIDGELYVPNINNIGIDVDFASIINQGNEYKQAVERIVTVKRKSLAPWLAIWSTTFWQDQDWIRDWLVSFMRETFGRESCECVYFMYSIPMGKRVFDANLKIHCIKGPCQPSREETV